MGVYVNQKCGECKKSFTGGYVRDYSGIGQPFVICDRCGTTNSNAGRITEWKLKSQPAKLWFIFRHVLSVVFYYGFGAGAVAVFLLVKNIIHSPLALTAIVGGGIAVGLLRFFIRLGSAIRDSNARMDDASYVAKLRRLGLFR